jgi:small subunit ribosomal protein S12
VYRGSHFWYNPGNLYLATLKQSSKRRIKFLKPGPRYKAPVISRTPILKRSPQVKGIVTRVVTRPPKKPNSAVRHVAKVDLNNGLRLTARLPGKGYLCAKYNRILISGGRANDIPGVGYRAVRGVYDFSPVVGKKKRRSFYGVGRPSGHSSYTRRASRR